MTDEAIAKAFEDILQRFDCSERLRTDPPLLAHYTSVQVLESILKNNEAWFSNPLFMNDFEELRFGLEEGEELFFVSPDVDKAAQTPERAALLRQHFAYYLGQMQRDGALDVYVFCVSEHPESDFDGALSMWRGYAANGSGVAVVFDPRRLPLQEGGDVLMFAKVEYGTREERIAELKGILADWCSMLAAANVPDDKLHIPAFSLYYAMIVFALTRKHSGFHEEAEWRLMWVRQPHLKSNFEKLLGYHLGPRGPEPKLKYRPIPELGSTIDNIDELIDRIILGPMSSSPLVEKTIKRMLELLGKAHLAERVYASTIPFRTMPGI